MCPSKPIKWFNFVKTEALCLLLRRFASPCRYEDLVPPFGRPVPQLSTVVSETMDLFYARFGNLFLHLNQPWLSQANLVDFSQSIYSKRAALDNCWGFIDGTVRPVARPGEHQTVLFNGEFMPLNFKVLLHLMALLLTFLVLWIWSCGRKET